MRIIHILITGVGNDTLWTTKVKVSRFSGAMVDVEHLSRTRAVDNPVD